MYQINKRNKLYKMRNILLILIGFVFLNSIYSQSTCVAISGDFDISTSIPVGGTTTYVLSIAEGSGDVADAGEIELVISFPQNEVYINTSLGVPYGDPVVGYFTWTWNSVDKTLYGINTLPIPAFDGGEIKVDIEGMMVSGNETTNATLSYAFNQPGCNDVEESDLSVTSAPLPVVYKSISAKQIDCSGNQVVWSTASEINNSHFEVEVSRDGKNYISVGKVKAGEKTGGDYKFTDNQKFSNQQTIYYRLKQVDFDGRFEYSEVVYLKYNCDKQVSFAVSPNPARDEVRVEFEGSDLAADVTAIIYDGNGAYVKDVNLNTGVINKLDISNLSPGIYTIQTNINNEQFNQRFIKVD